MHVFNSLAPIFLIVLLGMALRRGRFLTAAMIADSNRLTYWIGLPTLLFHEVAVSRISLLNHGNMLVVMIVVTLLCLVVGWWSGLLLGLPRPGAATMGMVAFRGNLAFIGLPVVIYAGAGESEKATLLLLLAVVIPFYNVLSVMALLGGSHQMSSSALVKLGRQLLTNPLIIACLGGVAYGRLLGPMPLWLDRSTLAIGQMALPLALLAIGASLRLDGLRHVWGATGVASLIKVAAAPLLGLLLGWMLGLSVEELRVVLISLACPTAVVSYVMADQLGGDSSMAAGTIALSTLLSFASLWLILWLLPVA